MNKVESKTLMTKTIAINFSNWISENKWYKQSKYDVWEKTGVGSKTTSDLYDDFIKEKK